MSKCTDHKIGRLIHAYETNTIHPDDLETFELHLLKCDYCFQEVSLMTEASRAIRHSEEVKREALAAVGEPKSWGSKLIKWLWPDTPVAFRPALSIALLLLMLYPAYLGLFPEPQEPVSAVERLNLYPTRSDSPAVSSGSKILVSFVVEGVRSDGKYLVEIQNSDNQTVFKESEFDSFDDYETGLLVIGKGLLAPGTYSLVISDAGSEDSEILESYRFVLLPKQ